MSGFPIIPMNAATVKTFTDAALATVESDVNTFLHAANSVFRLTAVQFYFDGTNHVAVVTYTGS